MASNSGGTEIKPTARLTGYLDTGTGLHSPFSGTAAELRDFLAAGGLAFFGYTADGSKVFGCLACLGTVVRWEDDNRKGKPVGGDMRWRVTQKSSTP